MRKITLFAVAAAVIATGVFGVWAASPTNARAPSLSQGINPHKHLVGNGLKRERHGEAERLCSLDVDDELELGRLPDRDISRLRLAQNLVDKFGCAPEQAREARSVGRQTTRFGHRALIEYGRKLI